MENASKALLIAGGMLLAIIIISIFMFTWGKISEYQSSKDNLASIEDTAKFNEQFTQYQRDDLLGYELLSLINKVIDYNERKTTDSNHEGEEKYPSITLDINILDENTRKQKLSYNNDLQLFRNSSYAVEDLSAKTSVKAKSSFENQILNKIKEEQSKCGGSEEALSRIAKDIPSLFMTGEEIEQKARRDYRLKSSDIVQDYQKNNVKIQMLNKYNVYAEDGYKLQESQISELVLDSKNNTTNIKYKAACMYYEYIQFKKAIFKCTKVVYDEKATGRIIELDFEFTGNIH